MSVSFFAAKPIFSGLSLPFEPSNDFLANLRQAELAGYQIGFTYSGLRQLWSDIVEICRKDPESFLNRADYRATAAAISLRHLQGLDPRKIKSVDDFSIPSKEISAVPQAWRNAILETYQAGILHWCMDRLHYQPGLAEKMGGAGWLSTPTLKALQKVTGYSLEKYRLVAFSYELEELFQREYRTLATPRRHGRTNATTSIQPMEIARLSKDVGEDTTTLSLLELLYSLRHWRLTQKETWINDSKKPGSTTTELKYVLGTELPLWNYLSELTNQVRLTRELIWEIPDWLVLPVFNLTHVGQRVLELARKLGFSPLSMSALMRMPPTEESA